MISKGVDLFKNDFPRTPAILFGTLVLGMVTSDLLRVAGIHPFDTDEADNGIVVHYVKFKYEKWNDLKVTTGSRYKKNDGRDPSEEWCYIDKIVKGGSKSTSITLAQIVDENSETIYHNITDESAAPFNASGAMLMKLAYSHCHFERG